MRQGRAVQVSRFGSFTFTAPSVTLEVHILVYYQDFIDFIYHYNSYTQGVTNQETRDKQQRDPVFVVSQEFIKGGSLSPAIFIPGQGLRTCSTNSINGNIQTVLINWTDIATAIGLDKETVKYGIERIFQKLASEIRAVIFFNAN